MKILVPAIGSRGDVQPFISLCQGLIAAGHSVTLATNPSLVSLGEAYSIPTAPVGKLVDMGAIGAEIMAKAGRNWWIGMIRTMQLGFRLVREAHPDLMTLVPDYDLVISTDTYAGATEADLCSKPWLSVTLQPARVPVNNPDVSTMMRLFFPFANGLIMAPINSFRKKVGAPPLKDMGSMLSRRMILIPVSPNVFPPHPQWPPSVFLTGYWFAQRPQSWSPSADLLAFLQNGEKPVAVSLGAMSLSGEYTRQAALITLAALKNAGLRAVIQGWDEALRGVELPTHIFHAGSLPHDWLFDQVRAVVHHGGFGTTAAAFRAGVPAVVIPHIIDQLYWGDLVTKLGTGPRYIQRPDLTAEKLAAALRQACDDQAMQDHAKKLGQSIRSEPDGVQIVVKLIEKTFSC